jgi:Na+-driven multidrug efflux pump
MGLCCFGTAYWTVGIPLGVLLTFHFDFGVIGIWTGHVCSLVLWAVLLSYRVARYVLEYIYLSMLTVPVMQNRLAQAMR